jgi:predicted Zn-dependent peptidase
MGHVARQYSGANLVLGAAGDVDPARIVREAEAAFGSMPAGSANRIEAPAWIGGLKSRQMPGSSQTHAVVGYAIPPLQHEDPACALAAALFGEGMSSPLLDQLRERRGLVYHAACSADVVDQGGQFVVEMSTSPAQLDECLTQLMRLLAAQAEGVDAVDLERARNQLVVRHLRDRERAGRRLEAAALDLLVRGALRPPGEWAARLAAVSAEEVGAVFRRLLASPVAAALTGSVGRGVAARSRATLGLGDAAPDQA